MKQRTNRQKPEKQQTAEETAALFSGQMRKLVAVVLTAMAALLFLLVYFLLRDWSEACLTAAPLVLCAALCLLFRRPGFWCAWVVFLLAVLRMAELAGLTPLCAFLPDCYRHGMWFHVIAGWVEVLMIAGLLVWTVKRFGSWLHNRNR